MFLCTQTGRSAAAAIKQKEVVEKSELDVCVYTLKGKGKGKHKFQEQQSFFLFLHAGKEKEG